MRPCSAAAAALVCCLLAAPATARPVLAELFTSEACSSCPPADAALAELARTRPDLLLLTFHVTYWNDLGWHDPYSLAASTERQLRYVKLGTSPQVYTPALVVDGRFDAVGSDGEAVEQALRQAALRPQTAAAITVQRQGDQLTVTVGAGTGRGTLLLVGYDPLHRTHVGRGENTGRTLTEVNIVRSIAVIGRWSGERLNVLPSRPAGQEVAVLLQGDDGHILGIGRLDEG